MGDLRNPNRVDELWDQHRVEIMDLEILTYLCELGVLSGGWAWHYMSPVGHQEKKIYHDHKDVDIFIHPDSIQYVIPSLKQMGYERIMTIYDDPSGNFIRFQKYVDDVKIIIDLFVEDVPWIIIPNGPRVVEPKTLLTFYSKKIHTTDDCVAVVAAQKLIKESVDIVGHPDLVDEGKWK